LSVTAILYGKIRDNVKKGRKKGRGGNAEKKTRRWQMTLRDSNKKRKKKKKKEQPEKKDGMGTISQKKREEVTRGKSRELG